MTAFDDYYQTTFTNSVENLSFLQKESNIKRIGLVIVDFSDCQ